MNKKGLRLKKKFEENFSHLSSALPSNDNVYSKDSYRKAHSKQRLDKLEKNSNFLGKRLESLAYYFASGVDINPIAIKPRIEIVQSNTLGSEIFRLATFNWSVPVSDGYGRRMRFLVWDDSNNKLIGIFALGDAVFNLKARDEYIGWSAEDRAGRMVNIMDAYILGAMPGYSNLLCGKLISALIKSKDVVEAFRDKYKNSVGVISGERKNPHLAAVTVTSALGKSSVYNRLTLDSKKIFTSIGMTQGWGHFHVSDELFLELVDYLESIDDVIHGSYDYGAGANWRIRILKKGLSALGLNPGLMKHGFKREIYICELASNAIEVLTGRKKRCNYSGLSSAEEMANLALNRWVIPRSLRDSSYLNYDKNVHFSSYLA